MNKPDRVDRYYAHNLIRRELIDEPGILSVLVSEWEEAIEEKDLARLPGPPFIRFIFEDQVFDETGNQVVPQGTVFAIISGPVAPKGSYPITIMKEDSKMRIIFNLKNVLNDEEEVSFTTRCDADVLKNVEQILGHQFVYFDGMYAGAISLAITAALDKVTNVGLNIKAMKVLFTYGALSHQFPDAVASVSVEEVH